MDSKIDTIYLGAGCFWCIEAVIQRLRGVHQVVSGYMGGHVPDPTYRQICTGTTGHAEVAKVTFDSSEIDMSNILKVFWVSHDPTTLNRQGNDRGTQYRSAIFYTDQKHVEEINRSISEVAQELYRDEIVTQVAEADTFYPAEPYHQNYYNRNGYAPYCRFVIDPKVTKLRSEFQHLLKTETNA